MSCLKKTFIAFKLIFFLCLTNAFAQDSKTIIAAKVNDHIISAKDVLIAFEKLPEKIKSKPLSDLYPSIVNKIISEYLISKQAYKDNLKKNEKMLDQVNKVRGKMLDQVKVEVNKVKEKIMVQFWVDNYVAKQINRSNIEKVFQNYQKNFKSKKEFNVSHILFKKEQVALNIIKKLDNKANFSDLAKKFSIGPSGKNGGQLDWFSSGRMVKEFENAVFLLNKGQITKKPVKTKFGFHIIKLNDVRETKLKKLSQIMPNIHKLIKQQSLFNLEKKIRKNQKISITKFEEVKNNYQRNN